MAGGHFPDHRRPAAAKTTANRTPWSSNKAFCLGIGLICLLEPLVHLVILTWAGAEPGPASIDFVWPEAHYERGPADWLRLSLLYVLLPAICEEWFFRGKLQPWLQGKLGTISAISLSSLWFSAVHGSILTVSVALPIGITLGLIYHYTGRLYACIAVHAFHNILMLGLGGVLIARPDLALILFTFGAWLMAATFSPTFVGTKVGAWQPSLSCPWWYC